MSATVFLRNFITRPTSTGALWPSSAALARTMTSWVGIERAGVVAEFGPGTGAVTQHILDRMAPGGEFFAVELNEEFHRLMVARFPERTIVRGSVGDVDRILADLGHGPIDAAICGLPWAAFPAALQETLLQAVYDSLAPGGRFVTFAYIMGLALPAGRRFRKLLCTTFPNVSRSAVVWRNMPPAFVYQCEKAR